MTNYYKPNDSPFGWAYQDWLSSGTVAPLSPHERDKFASVARSKLDTPSYADDGDLAQFLRELENPPRPVLADSVNDSVWLTHAYVLHAIKHGTPGQLRYFANECERVQATALAHDLREYADQRETWNAV